MSPYRCPSCHQPLPMEDLVRALLDSEPTCPECSADLPEDVRGFVDPDATLQTRNLAEPEEEPSRAFDAPMPGETSPQGPESDTVDSPRPWEQLSESDMDIDAISPDDTVDIPTSAESNKTIDLPGGATIDELDKSTIDLDLPTEDVPRRSPVNDDGAVDPLNESTWDVPPPTHDLDADDDEGTIDLSQPLDVDEDSHATIDLGEDSQGTIDLDEDSQATLDLDGSENAADDNGTLDLDNGTLDLDNGTLDLDNGTLDLDNGTLDLEEGTVDLGAPLHQYDADESDEGSTTIDLGATLDTGATIDDVGDHSPAEGKVSLPESGTVDFDEAGGTVDFDDKKKTVSDGGEVDDGKTVANTVDLGATIAGGGELTLDSDSDNAVDDASDDDFSMDDDIVISETLDPDDPSDSVSVGSVGTVMDGSTITESPNKGTVGAGKTVAEGGQTLDGSTLIGSDSRIMVQMPKMWATIDRSARPGATIRGEDQDLLDRSNLVIQTRELRAGGGTRPGFEQADYQLLQQLGEGGMGVVYAARQASIDRTVAIKMLKPAGAQNDRQRGKFLSEAVVTGELDHPNIVPIYDLGTNTDGSLFYSMKRVEGTPWDDVIRDKPLQENLSILMKVADAVAFAHDKGVLHRDLKPENVMLGDFGEVLVMDWGLAAPFQSHGVRSAGGTPAYMSPEMAAGPYEEIGVCSDVYLLGAMLFECLVGKPPHTGKTVMKCLMAAAKNEFRPHDVSGELMEVAMKAMQSSPHDRYASVKEFQAAIRDYLGHTESIELAQRAQEQLREAKQTENYDAFSHAVFAFEEAVNLWPQNEHAAEGLTEAKLTFAELAKDNEDYDLAASLLNPANPNHQSLLAEIERNRRDRDAHQQRLKLAKRAMVTLGLLLGVVITGAFFLVNSQRREALRQKTIAEREKKAADAERENAVTSRNQEIASRKSAELARIAEQRQRESAEKAREDEETARLAAVQAKDAALAAQQTAEQQRQAAVLAQQKEAAARAEETAAREREEYEAYVAKIGLAQAKINDNAFGQARQLLDQCPEHLRNWEWGRLLYLCSQNRQSLDAKTAVEALALHEKNGQRLLASAGRNGEAVVWDLNSGEALAKLAHAGKYVTAVAFSPDGASVVTGSNSPDAHIQVWNWREQQVTRQWKGHDDAVLSVEYSPDGAQLLTSSYDNTAKLWEVESGELARTLVGHTWWVWSARFSPDGKQIVTAGQDGLVFVWDAATGERSEPFAEHQGPVYSAAFSPDGGQVASAGNDQVIRLWRPEQVRAYDFKLAAEGESQETPHRKLTGHRAAIREVRFADGRLVSCGHDNAVMLWDASQARLLTTLRGHDSWIRSCWVSANRRQAISGGFDQSIKIWDIQGYEEQRVIRSVTLEGHTDAVLGANFSPDGDEVVTASRDRTARQWNASSGQLLGELREGHKYLATRGVMLREGKWLATAAVDNTTRIWDIASGAELLRLSDTGRGAALAVSDDGQWLATGGRTGQAKLWRVDQLLTPNPQPAVTYDQLRSDVTAIGMSLDARWVVIGEATGRVTVWNREGQLQSRLNGPTRRISAIAVLGGQHMGDVLVASEDNTVSWWDLAAGLERRERMLRHDAGVVSLAVSQDGNRAATCDAEGVARVWGLADQSIVTTWDRHRLTHVDLSEDGSQLMAVDPDQQGVHVWDVANRRELWIEPTPEGKTDQPPSLNLRGRGQVAWAASFADNGTVVVIGGDSASIWDPRGDQLKVALRPHGAVAAAAYSPDGTMIVTAGWDHSVRLWDVKTQRVLRQFGGGEQGHRGYVNSAAFTSDGRHIATASDDKTICVWEAATGKLLAKLLGHRAAVLSAVFTTDGDHLLSASQDGSAVIWDLRDRSMVADLKHPFGLRQAVISPDRQWIATACDDNRGRIWKRTESGQFEIVHELTGHTARVQSISFSPDATRVLTGSADFLAKLWDTQTGKEILTLTGHPREITTVRFSPDGREILSASYDGTAIVWPTRPWRSN